MPVKRAIGLCLLAAAAAATVAMDRRPGNNVVVVLVDTLRADRLGCYGYGKPTSPAMDRLAADGVLFERHFSVCNWTRPAVASLFTGLFPESVLPNDATTDPWRRVLDGGFLTVAEALKAGGVRSRALIQHTGIPATHGFAQGFESYTEMASLIPEKKTETEDDAAFLKRIGLADFQRQVGADLDALGDDSFFYYVHMIQPHAPYDPPERFRRAVGVDDGRKMVWRNPDLYDAEVRHADEVIGWITGELARRGLLGKTYIVVTSDHGEAFNEHGHWHHGSTFFNEVIRVPLIVRPPEGSRPPVRVESTTSGIDVFATILDFAGVKNDGAGPGRSLRRHWRRFFRAGDAPAFSEGGLFFDVQGRTVVDGDDKLYLSPTLFKGAPALFDLSTDFGERTNIAAERPDRARSLSERLARHSLETARLRRSARTAPMSEKGAEQLRSLGY